MEKPCWRASAATHFEIMPNTIKLPSSDLSKVVFTNSDFTFVLKII